MKNWFPFTDYDFWAYLTSGVLALAIGDYLYNEQALLTYANWTLSQGAVFVATAYIFGQIIASFSSLTIEHGLARKFLKPPSELIMAAAQPSWREKVIQFLVGGRGYTSLSEPLRNQIKANAASLLGGNHSSIDPESIFQVAYVNARAEEDLCRRIDDFRNQYGFCRNISFVALVATFLIVIDLISNQRADRVWLLAVSIFVFVTIMARFFKFYGAFSLEVFRSLLRRDTNAA